jgi:hypothetical protein
MRSALTRLRQALDSSFDVLVELDCHRANGTCSHGGLPKSIFWYYLCILARGMLRSLLPSSIAPGTIAKSIIFLHSAFKKLPFHTKLDQSRSN